MRKKFAGAATAVIIASSFAGVASASTHEVKSGDSLWKIASKYNTSVSQVKALNNLSSDLIYPKQVLFVNESTSDKASDNKQESNPVQNTKPVTSNTYKIVSGDNLSKIAARHNISLANLRKWNNLTSDLIFPGQVLKVSSAGGSDSQQSTAPNVENKPTTPDQTNKPQTSGKAYKVVSGDTLGQIARKFGTSVGNIKKWNNLSSDLILVGQTLNLNANASTPTVDKKPSQSIAKPNTPSASQEAANIVQIAKSLTGTKYVWGGSTTAGFDCSGFIYYVLNKSGQNVSRLSTDGYFNRTYYVNTPEVGDMVFFENTYKRGISHMGFYVGNNQFIHAGSDGVEISSLSNSYWKSKFNGYKKFY
ncbi:peptidoglycan endopeptidase [Bacillus sp. FSL K6-3431]|uniref:peptidoglycan endopeptidase n=1 Tax=Bacillus sp. FSL K6-3431 TaxID=2921500 RepID=UPI0030FC36FB